MPKCNPHDFLHSDSDDDVSCKMVTIMDKGGKTQRARVSVQGVPAEGVIDTGAEITIMGRELFRKVASANRLRKSEFKPPDKTPRTYNQQVFSLDGRIALDVCFGNKTMKTMVYVKMDTDEQSLLGEGVCRQLGIVTYHPEVIDAGEAEKTEARVPTVSFRLLKPVKVPPPCVRAQASVLSGVHLVEPDPSMCLMDGLLVTPTLSKFHEGITNVTITNRSGFTWEVEAGQEISSAQEAELVRESQEPLVPDAYTEVRQLQSQVPIIERKQKLRDLL